MAEREYDKAIRDHYRQVAETDELSWSSTMADEITRTLETDCIEGFVGDFIQNLSGSAGQVNVLEVGCGNAFTLGVLSRKFPELSFTGLEYSDELRDLALTRVEQEQLQNVTIVPGDIRDPGFAGKDPFDLLICQRVLINLLDPNDQKSALENLRDSVRPGGGLIFIEAFQSGLDRVNAARAEFDLSAIPPAHHNLYLGDDFFDLDGLQPYTSDTLDMPRNIFSTHYFVSRVFFPTMLGERPFKRNSAFVEFFSSALKPAIGDYTQLMPLAFVRG